MSDLGKFNYEFEGQIELSEYLATKIKRGEVKDLTCWINSHGKAQYEQIREVVKKACNDYKDDPEFADRLTNVISIYVLKQSEGYMEYLKEQSK